MISNNVKNQKSKGKKYTTGAEKTLKQLKVGSGAMRE